MVRVLDEEHRAVGPWNPHLEPEELQVGLRHMLLVRLFDDRMQKIQRQGRISFYIKSTGEEAVAVAAGMALTPGDMLFPSYRQQGLQVVRGRNLVDLMCQCLSNTRDMCKGRQMPIMYHWASGNIFSISGNLATQYPQAVGWAMAAAIKGEDRIAASWIGEGSSAEADFHYAMTFAKVYRAPVILNLVNNQWAISTFQGFAGGEQRTFAQAGPGYGIPGIRVDGNDFLAVYAVTQWAAQRARQSGGPTLIEHVTYRAAAHSTSDDPSRYRPKEEWRAWPLGDPVTRLKAHLIALGEWSEERHAKLEKELDAHVSACWKEAETYGTLSGGPSLDPLTMFEDVLKEVPPNLQREREEMRALRSGSRTSVRRPRLWQRKAEDTMARMNMVQALNSAMDVMLGRDPRVVVLGEDVGFFGGVFRATEGLQRKYGEQRVLDTPIAEGGIIAAAIGMGANGLKPVAEIQFADYIYPGFDQVVSELARLRYRSAGDFSAPVTIRSPCGGGIRGGQTHSQSPEALFAHVCGIKVVMPSNPYDAKGMLISSIEGDDPVVFFEPKRIYNGPFDGDPHKPATPWSAHPRGEVPEGHFTVPLGQAQVVREGRDVSVLAYGTMVHVAEAAVKLTGIDAEIIDVRTMAPLDVDTLCTSVCKTGRCVVVHEATRFGGYGAELVATVQEQCFWNLEAPIQRVAGWDTPYPHAFEWEYFPGPARIAAALRNVVGAK